VTLAPTKDATVSVFPPSVSPPREGVLALIGNTPLLRVRRMNTGICELYLKLESQNPGGSIKDRVGLSMIESAEASGQLRAGQAIVEATAGNTGIGLALVAAQKGYRLVLVIPDKMSREKVAHLRALGAEIVITRSDVNQGHPEYYQDVARRLAQEMDALYINQFENPANPRAHETTTAPEIWRQMDHRVDTIVCGVGSGGTLTGLGLFFGRVAPATEFVLADPLGSILAARVRGEAIPTPGSWLVEGIGEDFVPANCKLHLAKHAYTIGDAESFSTARALLRQEGILAGSSSGTLLAAALRYCREQREPKRVVTFVCDSGNKYLSKMYDDPWMLDQECLPHERTGDLRELLFRRADSGQTVTVTPTDTLLQAHTRMKLYDVSQVPVVEGQKVIGILDESDLLAAVHRSSGAFSDLVSRHMTSRLVTAPPSAEVASVIPLLERGMVVIVCEGERFLGLLTRIDIINWLKRRAS
jgi:cystathionine beta-synthase